MTLPAPAPEPTLPSWNDTPTLDAVTRFVERVTADGPDFVPPEERIAVFDNDGTLWCEKPMPIQLDFILRFFARMAGDDASLRDRQPWKAAFTHDHAWLGAAMVKHYQGDDSDLGLLIGGLEEAFGGMTVDAYEAEVESFMGEAVHPTLGRSYRDCTYLPMLELLRYVEANGFTTYIASGGDRDFMRPTVWPLYGIPPERVIGSSFALDYRIGDDGDAVIYKSSLDVFDDGPVKPVRIWSRIGRRPILAVGNSNGDVPMLHFAGGASLPALRVLVLHDDAEREFAYVGGAETALERARAQGWTVVGMKDDWASVFPEPFPGSDEAAT